MFMSDAPAPPLPIEPTRVGRPSLTLLRKLIDYGRELAATLQRAGSKHDPAAHQRTFGNTDIALILNASPAASPLRSRSRIGWSATLPG